MYRAIDDIVLAKSTTHPHRDVLRYGCFNAKGWSIELLVLAGG
jgi:hypothetical protein